MSNKAKQRTCKVCKEKFIPDINMFCPPTCNKYECLLEYANKHLSNKAKEVKTEQRKALKAFNDSDIKWLKIKAQDAVNRYIRERDKDKPCISCKKPNDGSFHAGHYRPRGNYSAISFHEDNISAQCPKCNVYLAANLVKYRENLVERIGLERVEFLESCTQIGATKSNKDLVS
jgi:hypothetical protein